MSEFINHTFVVCAYKQSEYLEECVQSLINQEVKSNIIMITSTPSEYIKNIAKKYNIPLYINEGKSGIGQDWNFGVSKTSTDYVTIAHQDDIYNKNYLKEIVKKIEEKKDFIIAFGDYEEIKNGKVIPLTNKMWAKKFALKFGSSICCPCVTINTKITGKEPYKINYKCDLDWDTWLEMSKKEGRFLYINKPLMKHRIHEKSETSNLIENNIRLDEDYEMLKKLWPKPIAKFVMHFYKKAIKTNS